MGADIIRTKSRLAGGVTPTEMKRLEKHSKKWIANAFRTEPADPKKLTKAIEDLYAAANLKKPRVVIVPSPLVMSLAYGLSAAVWHARKNGATKSPLATGQATHQATGQATGQATHQATHQATRQATRQATHQATDQATRQATGQATHQATDQATHQATDQHWYAELARELGLDIRFVSECARNWYDAYQGGNMWAAWDCYLTAFRDVLGLELPEHVKYAAWERAALNGGYRVLHPEFCLVCDFPEIIARDEENLPHNESGPSHRWRDGWSLWHIHGVVVDEQIVMHPETQTIEQINREQNSDVRSIRIARFGWSRYLGESGAKCVDRRRNRIENTVEALYDAGEFGRRLVATCPTGRVFAMGVPATVSTCEQAQKWLSGEPSFDVLFRT